MANPSSLELIQTNRVEALLNLHPNTSLGNINSIILPKDTLNPNKDVCFYRITRLSFDEDYPHREAFENVLLALDTTAFNLVYILSGSEKGIELYIGVVKNGNQAEDTSGPSWG